MGRLTDDMRRLADEISSARQSRAAFREQLRCENQERSREVAELRREQARDRAEGAGAFFGRRGRPAARPSSAPRSGSVEGLKALIQKPAGPLQPSAPREEPAQQPRRERTRRWVPSGS